MANKITIIDLKKFLKNKNPNSTLKIKDKENIKKINLSIDSVLINGAEEKGKYIEGSYIELYNDTQEIFKEPFTIKELLKELNRFDDMTRVDFISGNEDGEDRTIGFEIKDIIITPQEIEEKETYIAHLNDIEDEEMTYTRLKEYAHNIYLANIEDEEMKKMKLTYEDVKPENINMKIIKKLFEFMNEEFEVKKIKQKNKKVKQLNLI